MFLQFHCFIVLQVYSPTVLYLYNSIAPWTHISTVLHFYISIVQPHCSATVPSVHSSAVPQFFYRSVLYLDSCMGLQFLSSIVVCFHGCYTSTVLYCYCSVFLWLCSSMSLWCYGSFNYCSMVLRFQGCGSMVLWYRSSVVLYSQGPMVLLSSRSAALEFYRFVVLLRLYGSIILQYYRAIVLQFYGSMVLWSFEFRVLQCYSSIGLQSYCPIILQFHSSYSSVDLQFCSSIMPQFYCSSVYSSIVL